MQKTILIYGREYQNKETKNKFVAYTTIGANKVKYKVKFTKACTNLPTEVGYYDLTINTENIGCKQGKKGDNNQWKEYPTIWVREILKCTKDEAKDQEAKEKKQKAIDDALASLDGIED